MREVVVHTHVLSLLNSNLGQVGMHCQRTESCLAPFYINQFHYFGCKLGLVLCVPAGAAISTRVAACSRRWGRYRLGWRSLWLRSLWRRCGRRSRLGWLAGLFRLRARPLNLPFCTTTLYPLFWSQFCKYEDRSSGEDPVAAEAGATNAADRATVIELAINIFFHVRCIPSTPHVNKFDYKMITNLSCLLCQYSTNDGG